MASLTATSNSGGVFATVTGTGTAGLAGFAAALLGDGAGSWLDGWPLGFLRRSTGRFVSVSVGGGGGGDGAAVVFDAVVGGFSGDAALFCPRFSTGRSSSPEPAAPGDFADLFSPAVSGCRCPVAIHAPFCCSARSMVTKPTGSPLRSTSYTVPASTAMGTGLTL